MSKEITIKDIAKLAQVSIGTVDRVLHDRGRVSEATKEKILGILKETGYSPNLQASRLSRSKQWTVGAVFPLEDQDNGFWREASRGLQHANRDYASMGMRNRVFAFDRNSPVDLEKAVDRALADKVDALLLAPVIPTAAKRALARLPEILPFLLFDTPLADSRPLSFVGQDALSAGKLAARLLSLSMRQSHSNHRGFAVVGMAPEDQHIKQRIEGFLDFMKAYAEPEVFRLQLSEDPKAVSKLVDSIVLTMPEMSGIYVANATVGLVAEEFWRRGLKTTVIGHDLTSNNIDGLKKGSIEFLISQHPAVQTYEAMRLFWRHIVLRQEIPSTYYLPIEVLGLENWSYYREL